MIVFVLFLSMNNIIVGYRVAHLTKNDFILATNNSKFIHIDWNGNVKLTMQLNLTNPNSKQNVSNL